MKPQHIRDILVFGGITIGCMGIAIVWFPVGLAIFGFSIAAVGLFYR